ncbi:hypothetical protein HY213_01150 [Candidatus Peregrinibacteria bacterium]|nr:hypothetical protein [Candidatus Peregrinibacteria bacterium]
MTNTHSFRHPFLCSLTTSLLLVGIAWIVAGTGPMLLADLTTAGGSSALSAMPSQPGMPRPVSVMMLTAGLHPSAPAMPTKSKHAEDTRNLALLIGMLLILAGCCSHALYVLRNEDEKRRLKGKLVFYRGTIVTCKKKFQERLDQEMRPTTV